MTANTNTNDHEYSKEAGPRGKRVQKEMIGTVISARPDKTIVVKVGYLAVHPIFKKTVKRYNKFKAHDEKNEARTGDAVKIRETRPISKDKCWRLIEIVKKTSE